MKEIIFLYRVINKYYPPDFDEMYKGEESMRMRSKMKKKATKSRSRVKAKIMKKCDMQEIKPIRKRMRVTEEDSRSREYQDCTMQKSLASQDKFDYSELIKFQNIFGIFKDIPDKFKPLLQTKTLGNLLPKDEKILFTIIAVAILRFQCENTKFEWQMLEQKAISYLKSKGILNLNEIIEDLKSEMIQY